MKYWIPWTIKQKRIAKLFGCAHHQQVLAGYFQEWRASRGSIRKVTGNPNPGFEGSFDREIKLVLGERDGRFKESSLLRVFWNGLALGRVCVQGPESDESYTRHIGRPIHPRRVSRDKADNYSGIGLGLRWA